MDCMPRRAGRWAFLFLLFGAFLATVGEAADDVVPVPDVKDRPLAEARQALTAAGFLVAEAETSGQPEGTVLAQVPAPNAPTPRGAVVLLEVRRATAATQTPRATGLGVAEAMAALGSLYVIELEATTGAAADKGKVVGQVPAMGATLPLRGVLRLRYVPDTTVDPRVAVPDVSGLSSAEAAQALADAGLHARSATLVTSGVPPDLTVGQLPLPGTEVPRFSTVVLVVSVAGEEAAPGAPDVEVPNVTGMSESSARAELDRVSLGASVEWIDGDPSQAFLVAMQEPAAGESVAAGAEVALRIVRYAPPVPPTPTPTVRVAVPNLVGMSQVQAEDLLAHLGLLGAPVLAPRPGVPALRVFSQNLTAGRWVDPGTVVGYRVAEPPPPPGPIPVPNFFGQTHGGALGLAAQAGLSLQVLEVVTNAHAPHRIYSQSAPAWTWLPPGSQVTVKLARPLVLPPTAVVPSLAGKTPGQAMALLAAAGLTGSRTDVFTLQHPPLRVFAQAPAPGASVPVGTLVAYKVAKAGLDVRQVPHLGGKTKAQAIAAIQARGLVADVQFEVAPGKPLGLVFWQSPSPNALRPAGSTVHAKVAKPLLVVVPTVVGLPVNAAKAALEAVGLAHAVMLAPAPGQPAGKVWDQAPNAGASLAPGTVVTLRVPGPVINPGLVKVPNLIGLAPLAAKMALVSKGLVSDGKMIPAPFKPHDRVYSQSLAPNTFVASGTKVVWRWNP